MTKVTLWHPLNQPLQIGPNTHFILWNTTLCAFYTFNHNQCIMANYILNAINLPPSLLKRYYRSYWYAISQSCWRMITTTRMACNIVHLLWYLFTQQYMYIYTKQAIVHDLGKGYRLISPDLGKSHSHIHVNGWNIHILTYCIIHYVYIPRFDNQLLTRFA